MKKILLHTLFLSCLICGFLSKKASATHAAGAEIIYVHISGNTYQFFYKFYYDCDGIPPPPTTVDLCFYNSCTNQTFTRVMQRWTGTLPPDNRQNGSPVSAGCSQYPNRCINTSSSLPGFEEWWYTWIETLPLKCNSWRFSTSINARNGSQNITGGNLYVETVFNNTISNVNSSPFYAIKPIPYVCLNEPYTYNNGARDSDGDSLHTELMRPLTAPTCSGPATGVGLRNLSPPVNFTNNPFQTGGSFSLNQLTGQMSFTAGQQGAHALTIRTREYRNNQEIGSIMRDVQVQVIPCTVKAPVVTKTNVIGGDTLANGNIAGCIDQELSFCFDIMSNDTTAILLAEDNAGTAIPSMASNYTGQKTDAIRACFSWKPTAADAGKTHSFQIIIKDSTCDPPGILLQYVKDITIYVWPQTEASPDDSICIGEPIFLSASGGGDYEWNVITGNDPNMPTTGISPTGLPTITTSYQVVSTANDYCSNSNKDTVVITVEQGPDMGGQNDTTGCPGNPFFLDLKINRQTGATYDIKWTPATGLSSDTVERPQVLLNNDRTYYVEVGSDVNRCKSLDTTVVTILDGFSVENPDTAICIGEDIRTRATGDGAYTYLWTSTNTTAAFSNPAALQTSVTPGDTGTYEVVLRGSYTGCPDSVAKFMVTVEPVPTVAVNNDASLCFGDTMKLNGVVQPNSYTLYTYGWAPGASLDYPDRLDPIFTANQEGTTTLTLTATTAQAGCSASESMNIEVFPADYLELPGDTAICPGDSIVIAMNANGAPSFYWSPDFNISSVSAEQPKVYPVTDQLFTVYGKDSTGCLDTNQIFITVRPRAIVDLPDTVTLYPGESYRMDPGGNCLYYSWFPPLGLSRADIANPLVNPGVNTRYVIQARTEGGCSVTDSVDVLVNTDSYIDMPNAFSPHMRSNNTLKLIRRGDVQVKDYSIFNRWGTKVFQTTDPDMGWDGTFNGELQPTGVYIYTIEAVTPAGVTIRKQGNVTMLR